MVLAILLVSLLIFSIVALVREQYQEVRRIQYRRRAEHRVHQIRRRR